MSTIKLEDLYQEQNNVLTDLIIGVFHSSIKNGETWRARTLKSALRKGRTKKSAKGQFDLFLEQFNDFEGSTLGDFADYSGYRLIFWVGQNRSKNTRKIKEIIPEIEIRETHFLVPQIFSNLINRDFNKHVRTRTNVTEIEYRQEKMIIKNTDRQSFSKKNYRKFFLSK